MHLKSVELKNIKSVDHFKMELPADSGWFVLLGNNGAGKSTIIKAISLALVGKPNIYELGENWEDWLKRGEDKGHVILNLQGDEEDDEVYDGEKNDNLLSEGSIEKFADFKLPLELFREKIPTKSEETNIRIMLDYEVRKSYWNYVGLEGWFSAAYGAYRRFEGEDADDKFLKDPTKRLSAHITSFKPGIALFDSIIWLKDLKFRFLEGKEDSCTLGNIIQFINQSDLLPEGAQLTEVSSDGVFFTDANGSKVSIFDLSDGYRSILSLVLELLRQLCFRFKSQAIVEKNQEGIWVINRTGVVMIDEVDVHLHPEWQVRIGQWFLKYFPNIQFIVSTHSPLICQAAKKGAIWKLADPGTDEKSRKLSDFEYKRIVYGSILDAYSTEAFGENVTRSEESQEMLERLAKLNLLSIKGKASKAQEEERNQLIAILPTS